MTGCKFEKVACNTAGDEKEVILLLVDFHLINLEEVKEGKALLRPGFAMLILNVKLENLPIAIKCGVTIIELKGAWLGLIEPLNAKKAITLTEDVTEVALTAKPVTCDKENETVCQALVEKEPLLANVGIGFKAAIKKTTPLRLAISPMVLWND